MHGRQTALRERALRLYAGAAAGLILLQVPGFLAGMGRELGNPLVFPQLPDSGGGVTIRADGADRRVLEVRVGEGPWLPAGGATAFRDLPHQPAGTPLAYRIQGTENLVTGRVSEVSLDMEHTAGRSIQAALALLLAVSGLAVTMGGLDRRALLAGGFLAGLGVLFSSALVESNVLALRSAPLAGALEVVRRLVPGYPGLYFLVSFFSVFPADVSSTRRSRAARFVAVPGVVGLSGLELFLSVPYLADALPLGLQTALLRASVSLQTALYAFTSVVVLALMGAQTRVYRGGSLAVRDRRRAELAGLAFVVGLAPTFLVLLTQATFLLSTGRLLFSYLTMSISFLPLLVIPPALAYAVLSPRVEPVGLLVRRAVLYAFAEKTLRVLVLLPAGLLVLYLYAHRRERLDELFSLRPILLLTLAGAGILGLRYGSRAREALDRLFFREHPDARQMLQELVEKTRHAADAADLAQLVSGEIDAALHLESVALLVRDPHTGVLTVPGSEKRAAMASGALTAAPSVVVPPEVRERDIPPLDLGAELITLVSAASEPLEVDLGSSASPLRRLPEGERRWLADTKANLLVPLTSSDGALLGLLVLGGKRSETPFDREDRLLLRAIAISGALALENRLLRSSSGHGVTPHPAEGVIPPGREDGDAARCCPCCSRLYAASAETCPVDTAALRRAEVPHVFQGKLRFERLLGSGGMGVVYLARDLTLGRPVAVKTLPKMTPQVALRLRLEARAAASLLHPNLAAIFSAEAWHGTPMLVFEYLDGGTLADRIHPKEPLAVSDIVRWGIGLARGLCAAHEAGILHRDIKPSNVGFTSSGVPKLLDFGLARLLDDSRVEMGALSGDPETADPMRLTVSDKLVGTPPYLSPEAVMGCPPDTSFDLWGLAVTLYEATTGTNPFVSATVSGTLNKILKAREVHPLEARPDCPRRFAAFLTDALAPDKRRRPRSAEEFAARLVALSEV